MLAKRARLIAAVSVAAFCGCYDGSIEINFTPDAPGVDLTSFRIVVYAEATGEISCDALSFDEIPLDVLETTKVFEGTTEPGTPIQVSGVPRKGKKLFFAEAFVESGVSIFAGCEEVGEITEPTVVDIDPTLRTNSSFDSELVIRSGDGAGLIAPVDVTVLFLTGQPLPGSPVRWRLRGVSPSGLFESSGDVTTAGGMGRARITFDANQLPTARGPVELTIKTRWAQSPAPPLLGFLNPSVREAQVAAEASIVAATTRSADVLEVGTLQQGERPSIVVLASESVAGGGRGETNAHVFHVVGDDENAQLVPKKAAISVGETVGGTAARTLGKIAGDPDQIVAVWEDTGGLVVTDVENEASPTNAPFSGVPIKLSAAGGCDDGEDNLIVAQLAEDRSAIQWTLKSFNGIQDVTLAECDLRQTSDLIEIGCVRDTLDNYRSAFVFDRNEDGTGNLLETFRPSLGVGNPDAPGFTCGEIPADATTVWIGERSPEAEGTMLIGELTEEGPATARYLLQPIKSVNDEVVGMSADFQGADPTPLSVIATAEGDVNGDLETDVISLIALGRGGNGIRVAIHVSMAIPGSLDRLRATMSEDFDAIAPRLRVVDLNSDGVDDIVLGSTDTLRVYLMGPI